VLDDDGACVVVGVFGTVEAVAVDFSFSTASGFGFAEDVLDDTAAGADGLGVEEATAPVGVGAAPPLTGTTALVGGSCVDDLTVVFASVVVEEVVVGASTFFVPFVFSCD